MLSLKEKVEILKILEKVPFEETRIEELLKHCDEPDLKKPILSRIFEFLIEKDCEISAYYETVDEDVWESLNGSSNVLGEDFLLKEKIDLFFNHFIQFLDTLNKNEIAFILEIISPIFKVKTRNLQFMLFMQAKKYQSQVFAFLLSKSKKFPTVYAPFFSSLLVRYKAEDPSFKKKCLSAYKKHFFSLKPCKSISYLIILQGFVYIHCFKDFPMCDESKKLMKTCLDLGLFSLINNDVAARFISLYEFSDAAPMPYTNDCFYRFPFDRPIIRKIGSLIEENFVEFDD